MGLHPDLIRELRRVSPATLEAEDKAFKLAERKAIQAENDTPPYPIETKGNEMIEIDSLQLSHLQQMACLEGVIQGQQEEIKSLLLIIKTLTAQREGTDDKPETIPDSTRGPGATGTSPTPTDDTPEPDG